MNTYYVWTGERVLTREYNTESVTAKENYQTVEAHSCELKNECLIFTNKKGQIITAYASGQWKRVERYLE